MNSFRLLERSVYSIEHSEDQGVAALERQELETFFDSEQFQHTYLPRELLELYRFGVFMFIATAFQSKISYSHSPQPAELLSELSLKDREQLMGLFTKSKRKTMDFYE